MKDPKDWVEGTYDPEYPLLVAGRAYKNPGPGMCGTSIPWLPGTKMSHMTKKSGKGFSPNKYPGKCDGCGCWIPAGQGVRLGSPPREPGGKWTWSVSC